MSKHSSPFYISTNQNKTQAPPPTPPDLPCIIYVRIPKTGSSSLVSDMFEWLGPQKMSTKYCRLNDGEQSLLDYKELTAYRARQVYQGHCNYGFDRYICLPPETSTTVDIATTDNTNEEKSASSSTNSSCYYYTWLREPISRVISSIMYNHQRGLPTNLTTLEHCFRPGVYCEQEGGPNWQNTMTYMLGSPRDEIYQPNRSVYVTREHLQRAKRRLEHNFVAFGLLDFPKESVRVLRSLLQLPPLVKRYDYGNFKNSNRTAIIKKVGGVNIKFGGNIFALNHSDLSATDEKKIRKIDSESLLSHYNAATVTNTDANSLKERIYQELGLAIRQANLLDLELYEFAKTLFQDRLLRTNTSASTRQSVWDSASVKIHSCPEPKIAVSKFVSNENATKIKGYKQTETGPMIWQKRQPRGET